MFISFVKNMFFKSPCHGLVLINFDKKKKKILSFTYRINLRGKVYTNNAWKLHLYGFVHVINGIRNGKFQHTGRSTKLP